MTSDDPLEQAIELLTEPAKYQETFGRPIKHEFDNVIAPLVTALRNTIGEVQSLRDEVAELRGEG